jgi:hypothetical protein
VTDHPHRNGATPVPDPPPRNVAFERRWTSQAAEVVHVNAERLIEYAEHRAGPAPVRDLDTRNFAREVVEELADARNYLVWWAEQLTRADNGSDETGEMTSEICAALSHVAAAFEHAERARHHQATWRTP